MSNFGPVGCLERVFFMMMAEAPETQPKPCKHISRLHFHPLASPWPKQVMMTKPKSVERIYLLPSLASIDGSHDREKVVNLGSVI